MAGEQEYLRAIGGRIRELRAEKGWSQEELAHRSALDRTYISTLENGERNLAALNLRPLARAFGVSVSDMLRGIT